MEIKKTKTNTRTKLTPYGIIINRNQNLPFPTSLRQFFENYFGFNKYNMPYLDSP